MGLKKVILNIMLSVMNFFIMFFSIKQNRITFISLESDELESDLELIYNQLVIINKYDLRTVLINYNKKSILNNFKYMLNCYKQLYYINTSKVVIINDNNYVISKFKRDKVKVIQVWHAAGAIKKFGNELKREYLIKNYDFIIANSDYWKAPYSKAFAVKQDDVKVLGMPRIDHLFDIKYLDKTKEHLLVKYPLLLNKKVLLYAPTFRGNIYKGFKDVDFDVRYLLDNLGGEYVLIYKLHPLLRSIKLPQHPNLIDGNSEAIHDLFTVSDALISDFSSIIFDYSLLNKPMYFYAPDVDAYLSDIGCFVDYKKVMPGKICLSEKDLLTAILDNKNYDISSFKERFFKYNDGKNTTRVVNLIEDIIKKDA